MSFISKLKSNIKKFPHWKIYIGFFSLLVIGLTVVSLKIILIKLNERIKRNKYKIRKVKQTNKELRAKIAKLSQKQRLEKILSSSKGLHPPDIDQIAILQNCEKDSTARQQHNRDANKFLAIISNTFKKIAPQKQKVMRSALGIE